MRGKGTARGEGRQEGKRKGSEGGSIAMNAMRMAFVLGTFGGVNESGSKLDN